MSAGERLARDYLARTRRAVLVSIAAQWLAVLVGGALAAGAVLVCLEARGAGAEAESAFARLWSLALALACAAGAAWQLRPRGVARRTRRALATRFPEERRAIDAWLSDDLVCANGRAVRRVLEERLDRSLPRGTQVVPPEGLPRLRAGLAAALVYLVAVGAATGSSPPGLFRRLADGLFGPGDGGPLAVTSVGPDPRWLRPGAPARVRFGLNRAPRGPASVALAAGGVHPLAPAADGETFEAELPALEAPAEISLEAEGRSTPALAFGVYPRDVLSLAGAASLAPDGTELARFGPSGFPVSVDAGTRVTFDVDLRACPVRAVGVSGQVHGELALAPGGPARLSATVAVRKDDAFGLWWEYPDGTRERKGFYPVRVRDPAAPRLRITAPGDGSCVEWDSPVRVEVTFEHDAPARKVLLLGSDYHGMVFSREVKLARRPADGVFAGAVEIRPAELPPVTGRVVGVCAAAAGRRGRKVAFSDVANLLLPRSRRPGPAPLATPGPGRPRDGAGAERPGALGPRAPEELRLYDPDTDGVLDCADAAGRGDASGVEPRPGRDAAEGREPGECSAPGRWSDGEPIGGERDGDGGRSGEWTSEGACARNGAMGEGDAADGRPDGRAGDIPWMDEGDLDALSRSRGGSAGDGRAGAGEGDDSGSYPGGRPGGGRGDARAAGSPGGSGTGGGTGGGSSGTSGGQPGGGPASGRGGKDGTPASRALLARGRKATPGRAKARESGHPAGTRAAAAGNPFPAGAAGGGTPAGGADAGAWRSGAWVPVSAGEAPPLGPSEREAEIAKYDEFARRLEAEDRRVVHEYYRLLRDAKE